MKLKVRKINFTVTQILKGIEFDLLIPDHTGRNFYLPVFKYRAFSLLSLEPLQDGDNGLGNLLRVVIPCGFPDVGPPIWVVELLHRIEF